MKHRLFVVLFFIPVMLMAAEHAVQELVFKKKIETGSVYYDEFDGFERYNSDYFLMSGHDDKKEQTHKVMGQLSWFKAGPTSRKKLTFRVAYYHEDWLHIDSNRPLKLLITKDGVKQRLFLIPKGKTKERAFLGIVKEIAEYGITDDQLREISEAESVKYKLYGDDDFYIGTIYPEAIQRMELIYFEQVKDWVWSRQKRFKTTKTGAPKKKKTMMFVLSPK